ncbi:unnamed protein product [Prunus armeniaca]|uniref:MLO-like protein n=1 Tax=Prunus armeniaca TaxID=36596 RepID=A0A6J5XQQ6_PRUAR|nr:unnamed protein product [Prunus armeniaca]
MAVASEGTSIEYTPTWALATVYSFIFTAVFLRYSIHLLANVQLMFLGFASLLLALTQDSISKFCIPAKLVDTMLPCRKKVAPESTRKEEDAEHFGARNFSTGAGGSYGEIHRLLAEEAVSDSCSDCSHHGFGKGQDEELSSLVERCSSSNNGPAPSRPCLQIQIYSDLQGKQQVEDGT